jgi:hypothetical protein
MKEKQSSKKFIVPVGHIHLNRYKGISLGKGGGGTNNFVTEPV